MMDYNFRNCLFLIFVNKNVSSRLMIMNRGMQSHTYSYNSLRHSTFITITPLKQTNLQSTVHIFIVHTQRPWYAMKAAISSLFLKKAFILPGITSPWVSAGLLINKTMRSTSVVVRQRLFRPDFCLRRSAAPLVKTCLLIAVSKSLDIL